MDLLTPDIGLFFWQTVVFLLLVVLLRVFAWTPILNALKIREESIQDALSAADEARKEIDELKADNEKLLDQARIERDKILKEARDAANMIKEQANLDAAKSADKIILDAKAAIATEKDAAMADVRNQVAQLSLQITEKVLRVQLEDDKKQKDLIDKYLKAVNLN